MTSERLVSRQQHPSPRLGSALNCVVSVSLLPALLSTILPHSKLLIIQLGLGKLHLHTVSQWMASSQSTLPRPAASFNSIIVFLWRVRVRFSRRTNEVTGNFHPIVS